MQKLFLIRHGKPAAVWGEADEDPGLDDAGRAQAEAARDHLLSLPEDQRPRRVVSSPLRRCRETAAPTAEGVANATTRTVVIASLSVLALDFILTVLMFRGLT